MFNVFQAGDRPGAGVFTRVVNILKCVCGVGRKTAQPAIPAFERRLRRISRDARRGIPRVSPFRGGDVRRRLFG